MVVLIVDNDDIPKPVDDKRSYRLIRLDNKLECLVIHDPEMAAQAVDMDTDCDEAGDDGDGDESDEEMGGKEEDEGDDEGDEEEDSEGEDSKKAAAALAVGVGSFSDGPIGGLAHFLEHMLFMGTEKYPDENDFSDFTTKHGGSSNAYTECEMTVFAFDIQPQKLKEALDRFAQFFVAPLMKVGAMEREAEAVDSEFIQALPQP